MSSSLRPSFEQTRDLPTKVFGQELVSLASVLELACGRAQAALSTNAEYRARLAAGQAVIAKQIDGGASVYGVNTGVGASVQNAIPDALYCELPLNLLRFHGCGTGRILEVDEAAAVVAVRLASLARGFSGVRESVLQRLCNFLNLRLLPCIPAEGSVGASGDLTPLSYLAAALVGEREMTLNGVNMSAAEAHAKLGLEPLVLNPKESLAIMNGTSMMAGLGCLAYARAQQIARFSTALTAMAVDVMHGNPVHFDARIFELKPHPGQITCASWLREDLAGIEERKPARLQDRYSLRCAPHIIGVLLDALASTEKTLEIEVNSVNDNPIILPDTGEILHGGNFYGGHLCFAFDGVKAALANVAELLERQLVLLCVPETSDGLPENLVAVEGPERVLHHGFKAMQITASALVAEALKLASPASVFSRSTESHNQDKVSMGPIAVRECLRILDLVETVAAIHALALCQAFDLRSDAARTLRASALHSAIRKVVPICAEDRRQDRDIDAVRALYRDGELPIGTSSE